MTGKMSNEYITDSQKPRLLEIICILKLGLELLLELLEATELLAHTLTAQRSILGRTSQRLPLRILDLEFVYQNPLRTSRDDPWDH